MIKKNILFKCGNLYTFKTHTIYNIKSLDIKLYDITLIVTKDFINDAYFLNFLKKRKEIKFVIDKELISNNIYSHYKYIKFCQLIIDMVKPDCIIQNDYIEIKNMYIFKTIEVKKIKCKRIVLYETAPYFDGLFNYFDSIREAKINGYLRNIKLSKYILNSFNYIILLNSYVSNKILPKFFNYTSYLHASKYSNINTPLDANEFDYIMTQYNQEALILRKLLKNEKSIIKYNIEFDVDNRINFNNNILFLPSLLKIIKFDQILINKLKLWVDILTRLKKHFNIQIIYIKFHPNVKKNNNDELTKVKAYLSNYLDITYIDEQQDVMPYIYKASFVIGDTSSLLLVSSKITTTISIDFCDEKGSNALNNYENIIYYKYNDINLDKIIYKKIPRKKNEFYNLNKILSLIMEDKINNE